MSYWKKRKEGWLDEYYCGYLLVNLLQRPKWCLHAKHNNITHKFCKGCECKKEKKNSNV